MNIAAFTGGRNVPSARFRIRQYIRSLARSGIDVMEFTARLGSWPPPRRILRPIWGIATLLDRVPGVLASRRYDLTFLQREMLSTFVSLERWVKAPRVLDVDDAIWLHKRGDYAKRLAAICRGIICGNEFLAEYFRRWSSDVRVIPTAVDTSRFQPARDRRDSEVFVLGWCGQHSGLRYLLGIESALESLLRRHRAMKLRIVCDTNPGPGALPAGQVEFMPWSIETEVTAIQGMDVGLMPLLDDPWCRGKCSYKMLLYMACGLPVVVSPVGMNPQVLKRGQVGLGASSMDEWVDAIEWLAQERGAWSAMGREGRRVVEEHYSLQVLTPVLAECLREMAE